MLKKYVTPLNIVLVCALIFSSIPREYEEYKKYFLYVAVIIIIPLGLYKLIKLRMANQLYETKTFWPPIYRMGVVAVVLLVFFFLTKQNYI
jgi:predicted Na+-dependent transporter